MEITLMLKKICDYQNSSKLETIEQRFLLIGHDSNDCNKCFEAIDRRIKVQQARGEYLYTPNDWVELISSAKQSQPPYTVINMTSKEFFSVSQLLNFVTSEKHFVNGEKIFWTKISNIKYTLSEPLKLSVCYANRTCAARSYFSVAPQLSTD